MMENRVKKERDLNDALVDAHRAFSSALTERGHDPTFFRLIMTGELSTDIDFKPIYRVTIDFDPTDEIPPIRYTAEKREYK